MPYWEDVLVCTHSQKATIFYKQANVIPSQKFIDRNLVNTSEIFDRINRIEIRLKPVKYAGYI